MEINSDILKPLGQEFIQVGQLEDLVYDIKQENIPKINELISQIKDFEYSYIFHLIIHVASVRPFLWRPLAELWSTLEKPHKRFMNYPFTEYLAVRGILSESDLSLVLGQPKPSPTEMEITFRKGSLEEAILHDDVEKMKKLTAGRKLDTITFLIKDETHSITSFAAYYGAIKCFRYLIEEKCSFEEETPQYAALGGNIEIVSLCRDQGYSLYGCLKGAVQANHKELANWLLKNVGYEPVDIAKCIKSCNTAAFVFFATRNMSSNHMIMSKVTKKSPLIVATEIAHLTAVKYLVEKCDANVETPDQNGWNAFAYASDYQYNKISNYLLDHGADIEKCGNGNWTPLLWAASAGNDIAAQFLIERGANIEAINADGNTPIMVALKAGHIEVAEILIKKHPQLEVVDMDGFTILLTTSMNGLLEGVKLLVENGANIEANKMGLTAFYFAVLRGQFKIAKYLVEKGANIEPKDQNGITPLIFCSSYGLPAAVQMLIDIKVNIEAKDNKGLTSLMWASRNGKDDIVDMLIKAGADVNETSNEGDTALLLAVKKKNLSVIKILLENGADPTIANNKNWNAISASGDTHDEAIISLVTNGAMLTSDNSSSNAIIYPGNGFSTPANSAPNITEAPAQSQSNCCLLI